MDGMSDYKRVSDELSDNNSCVPKALAIVSGRSAKEVNDRMIANGRRKPGRGVRDSKWLLECADLGLHLTDVTREVINAGGKTVRTVERVLDKNKIYLIGVSGHLLSYRDGKIQDWSAGRVKRITRVYLVDCDKHNLNVIAKPAKVSDEPSKALRLTREIMEVAPTGDYKVSGNTARMTWGWDCYNRETLYFVPKGDKVRVSCTRRSYSTLMLKVLGTQHDSSARDVSWMFEKEDLLVKLAEYKDYFG